MENIDDLYYQDQSFESVDSCEKVLLNLTEMGDKQRCKFHQKNEVILICLQSQWHCEELCVDCVEQHNQQHKNENQTANLKKIDQVILECKDKIDKYLEQYKILQEKIKVKQINLKNGYTDQFIEQVNLVQQQVISKVNEQFDIVKQQYLDKIGEFIQDKKAILDILYKDIKRQQDRIISNLEKYENNKIQAIKDIYFKNFQKDLQFQISKENEYDEYKPNIKVMTNYEKITSTLENINSIFYIKIIEDQKNKHIEKTDNQKLKEKIKNEIQVKKENEKLEKRVKQLENIDKKQKCPVCRNQMVYVSEFKKHLTCLNCKQVKRLYTDKNNLQNTQLYKKT